MRKSKDKKTRFNSAYTYGRKPAGFFYAFFLKSFYFFIKRIFNVTFSKDEKIGTIKGPVIILGNHPSNIDPVLIAAALYPRKINFLTASLYFSNPLFRLILYFLGCIPKTQFRADPKAVKSMLKVVKRKGLLGIFPEGSRSADGTMSNIEESISKFVKKTKATLVIAKISGAYLSWPRWTKSGIRRGRTYVNITVGKNSDDISEMSLDDLSAYIKESLWFNEYSWQKKNKILFRSRAPAKGLDSVLHRCPSCNSNWAMKTRKNIIFCSICNNSGKMDQYGLIYPMNKDCKIFETVHEWNIWQKKTFINPAEDILLHSEAIMYAISDYKRKKCLGSGRISLDKSNIIFEGKYLNQEIKKMFSVSGILGISARYGKHFDIIEDNYTYRFFPDNGQKAIGFAQAIEKLRESKNKSASPVNRL